MIEPIRQDNTALQVSIPVQADDEEVASKVSIPLEASISPQVMCMKAYDGLHVYALSKDPEIFSIKNTHGYEEAIMHSVSESRKRLTELKDEECLRDGQYHWTDEITNSLLQHWIRMISVQGVFNLGCKHPSLPCYCPFQRQFSSYIDEIGMSSYFVHRYNYCDKPRQITQGWSADEMCSHYCNGKNGGSWYHILVDAHCTKLYNLRKKRVKRKSGVLRDTPPIQGFSIKR